ncbi:hypothetical protein CSB92_0007 [Pseudomonas aeruginosa]|nr:hypothetical protein CSB92_0007 [Pseudomonas aeruginosa]
MTLTAHHTPRWHEIPGRRRNLRQHPRQAFLVQHQKITVETQDAAPAAKE